MAAWLPSTVTKGFSRISLVAWGEIIFEWKVVKKVSFVQTKLQLCQSYLRRGSRLPPAAFEWWRGSPLSSSGCVACSWTPGCSHRSNNFNVNQSEVFWWDKNLWVFVKEVLEVFREVYNTFFHVGDLAPPVELDVAQELGVVRHLAKYFVISGEKHFQAMRVSSLEFGLHAPVQSCNNATVHLCNRAMYVQPVTCGRTKVERESKTFHRFSKLWKCRIVIFTEGHSK